MHIRWPCERSAAAADPLPLNPQLLSICGRDADALSAAAARFGWAETVTDWRTQVEDERIGLFDNAGPNNLHAEPTIAAARSGKHVFCEKPLGVDADQAHAICSAAEAAGVVHMTAFNYRFFPAVRLAREMIAAGELDLAAALGAVHPVDDFAIAYEALAAGRSSGETVLTHAA